MSTKDISDIEVIRAVIASKNVTGVWPYHVLMGRTKEPEKVCLAAMERAVNRGYLEYGVSLRSAWVSSAGLALLKQES